MNMNMNVTPISGMNAASFKADNVANNVANVNTQGFTPQRVEQAENVARTEARQPAAQAARDTYEAGAGTNVYAAGTEQADLARDMTNMMNERNTYTANSEAMKMQNEIVGTTIDLVG